MAFDAHANFAISTVATAPVTPTAGTSVTLATGDGAKFPAAPFNVVIWPTGVSPSTANAEIARCTAKASDTLTIVRTAETGGINRTVVVGDQIMAAITAKTLTDIESAARQPFPGLPVRTPLVGTSKRLVLPLSNGTAIANGNLVEGCMLVYLLPVLAPCTLIELFVAINAVGTAGAVGRFGLYDSTGTKVLDNGTFNTGPGGSTGAVSQVISQALTAQDYYVTYTPQGAAATPAQYRIIPSVSSGWLPVLSEPNINGVYNNNVRCPGYFQTGVTGALPANLSGVTAFSAVTSQNICPIGVGHS